MSKVECIKLNLERQNGVYFADETIIGSIYMKVNAQTKINNLKLYLNGGGFCHWKEGKKTYMGFEKIMNLNVNILPNEYYNSTNIILEPGEYNYKFEIKLPEKLPSSFYHMFGRIKYEMKATLDIAWSLSKSDMRRITILSFLNLNTLFTSIPSVQDEFTNTKTFCCCCCQTEPINPKLYLSKTFFAIGETITFNAFLDNPTSRVLTMECGIRRMIKLTSTEETKTLTYDITVPIKYEKNIEPKTEETWRNGQLYIPFTNPTDQNSAIIKIYYFVSLRIKTASASFPFYVNAPIVIGTIPFVTDSQQLNTVPYQPLFDIQALPDNMFMEKKVKKSIANQNMGKSNNGYNTFRNEAE
jgi:hypothetical protein